jgi:DNA-binding IclR family transcriptional regulator
MWSLKGIGVPEAGKSNRYNIRVVDRAISVLIVLADGKPRTLTELSKEIDISSSTTFRLLATLLSHNLVRQEDSTGQYRLGLACLELARAYSTGNEIRSIALPVLEGLRNVTKETVHLAVLDELEIIYLEKLEGLHAIGLMSSRVGRRAPAYCTGIGKALLAQIDSDLIASLLQDITLKQYTDMTIIDERKLLAHLELVRNRGYALDLGEHENDVRCVAAPVFDQTGKTVAAISVSGPKDRIDPVESNHLLIEQTTEAASTISGQLGYQNMKTSSREDKNAEDH